MPKSVLQLPLVAATTLLVGLGACTLEPAYQRPASTIAASYPTGGAYQNGVTAAPPAVEIGWRDFFVDPRLQKLIDLALRNNPDLRVAILNVQVAQAQYRIERAGLFPTLSGVVTGSRSHTPADLSFFGHPVTGNEEYVEASASWQIDLFGKIRSLSHQALAQYFATAEARKAAQLSLVSEVANQYLTLLAYDDALAVTRSTLKNAEESYRLAKAEFGVGNETALDLSEAETVVDQAKANLAAQIRLRAQAANALELLVGTPLPADLPPGLPLDSQNLLTDIPAGLPSDLLARRPDIAEAEDSLRAANANIGAARAAFFPSISLTGDYGTASTSLNLLFHPGQSIWSFGPTVDLPIFEGGTNTANLDVAKTDRSIAVAQYQKAIETAFREVADGLAARGTYDDQVAALAEDTKAEQTRLDLSTLRFHSGIDSYLTVLTAQTDLYTAQQNLITTRLSRATNLVDLYQYLGGGWIEHSGDTPRPADTTN